MSTSQRKDRTTASQQDALPGRDVTRSTGQLLIAGQIPLAVAGGGYQGITPELDQAVAEAAALLQDAYRCGIEIRFNSDRESGGGWIRTADGRNDQVGICATLVTARHRAQAEASARICETEAATGRASWQTDPLTDRQRAGAREAAAYDRNWLAENPEGQLTIIAHLAGTAVRDTALRRELEQLPGWNPMGCTPHLGYHHGEAATVTDALNRCLRFAPPGSL